MRKGDGCALRRLARPGLLRWLAVGALCAGPGVAQAQIGSGWTRLTLTEDFIDTQSMGQHMRHPIASFTTSGARYDKSGDSETFELYDPSFNRVEHDTNHHYKTGKIQFEGTVQIYPGVNHQFIVQLFNAPASGPIMALSAYSRGNGTIVKQGGGVEVATNVFGKDVKVNIIHDLDANTLAVYVDGVRAWAGGGGAGGGFNFKYGSYGSLNGSPSAKARWQNVQFWTAGGGGPDPGPGPDAGAPRDAGASADAASGADTAGSGSGREDAASIGARDAAAGGAGGASGDAAVSGDRAAPGEGSGGSGPGGGGGGGSGGAGGSKGAAGSGGTADPGGGGGGAGPDGQAGSAAGCGCGIGDRGREGGATALLAALVVAAALRGRRGRERAR
jgi:hypothetical protein